VRRVLKYEEDDVEVVRYIVAVNNDVDVFTVTDGSLSNVPCGDGGNGVNDGGNDDAVVTNADGVHSEKKL